MARSIRNYKLDTRTNRLKLNAETYYSVTVGDGFSIRYRRPKSGNGTWQVRIRLNDKYIHQVVGEADDYMDANNRTILTFYQAQDKSRMFSEEIKRPSRTTIKPVTVGDATAYYLEWFRDNRKSIIDTERAVNAHILPVFGNKLLIQLSSREIKHWHEKLATTPPRRRTQQGAKQNYGNLGNSIEARRSRKSTANRILTILKAILNKAFTDGLAPDDKEWRRVKPFNKVDEPITRFLTVVESKRLINACNLDFRLLTQAALFTGCRYGELTRILVTHVNVDTELVYISPESKSGKGRHVPLSNEGLKFFENQIVGKLGLDYVLMRKDGKPWQKNHQSRLMKNACIRGNINPPICFHELRHTYASLLAQAGADLLTISKLLGHADTRITSRHYAHLCDKTLANAVKTMLPDFGTGRQNNRISSIS